MCEDKKKKKKMMMMKEVCVVLVSVATVEMPLLASYSSFLFYHVWFV